MRAYHREMAVRLIALAVCLVACGGDSIDLPASDDLADDAAAPDEGDGVGVDADDGIRVERPGRIAFASERDGNREIYVMDVNGDNQRNVTKHPGDDFAPVWSPDGKSIAFVSTRERIPQVYAMDADGAHQRNITNSRHWAYDPAWSPDGRQIALSTTTGGTPGMLHIMKSDGGALRSVNNNARGGPWHEEVHPAWSPDGKTIVYAADGRGANNVLYAVDADGADRCQLTDHQGGDGAPAWSPDGETIAFHRGIGFVPQVHLMDPTGARRRQLTFRPGANGAPNVVAGW